MAKARLRRRLRRWRRRLMFLGLRRLMRSVGVDGARRLGVWLGTLQYGFARTVRRRCARDMALALGRAPGDRQTDAQLLEAYRINTAAVLQLLALFERPTQGAALAARCAIDGAGRLREALAGQRGAILLATHSGNTAMLALRLAAEGHAVSVVFRQSRMMTADYFAQGLARYGIDGILANEGLKAYGRMLSALRQNRIVFIMMDQGVRHAADGIVTRFLGKDMPMPAGPAQLARHARAPILPVVTTGAGPVWRFRIGEAVVRAPNATLEADFEQLVRLTERQILAHPQFWSWHHRRWRRFAPAQAS